MTWQNVSPSLSRNTLPLWMDNLCLPLNIAARVESFAEHRVDLVVVILWVPPISRSIILSND